MAPLLELFEFGGPRRLSKWSPPHHPPPRHISDQDTSHAQGHPEHGGYLRHRAPIAAEPENGLAFRAEARKIARLVVRRSHHRLDLELVPGLGPAPGHRIRPDQPAPG